MKLYIASIDFASTDAHVGRARQVLFDEALSRLRVVSQPNGLILSTDADTQPTSDWIAYTQMAVDEGASAVGGRILLKASEEAKLPPVVRRSLLMDVGYRRALEELRCLYAPEVHDPFPRHHQHFGGSFAVTAQAYAAGGGMPLRRSSEDVALFRAIVDSGGLVRHCPRVKVHTSARMVGRAQGGLADALKGWNTLSQAPVIVESAKAAEVRLSRLGLWIRRHPTRVPPWELATTPDSPPAGDCAEIHTALRALRERLVSLRRLSLSQRLVLADQYRVSYPQSPFSLD